MNQNFPYLCVGTHYLLNFYECDLSSLAPSKDEFEKTMGKIAKKVNDSGLTVLSSNFHFFEENAVTGFFLLAESHIAFHSWPEKNFVSADIFICHHTKDNNPEAKQILEFLKTEIFKAQKAEMKVLKR
jgi:S-adenosylmethionine decarboxylase proenzyme